MKTKKEKDELFASVHKMIYSICAQYPALNTADLRQDACLAVYNSLDLYDPSKAKLTTYAYYIVKNFIQRNHAQYNLRSYKIPSFKVRKSQKQSQNKRLILCMENLPDDEDNDAYVKPCQALYMETLSKLSDEDQSLISEYMNVKSIKKLSVKTGIPTSVLNKRIKNIKKNFRSILQEEKEQNEVSSTKA